MYLCCINQYKKGYQSTTCCAISSSPQMLIQEPAYEYGNVYKSSRHKFGGVKTILKTKSYLELENFITNDSDLSCITIENCKWSNDPNDELDWSIINNENSYVKNVLPKKFLQNGIEYLLISTDERPPLDSAILISDPINCQNTYGYLSLKCYISQPHDIGTPPILEICTKIVKHNTINNCQRVYSNPNYYVHAKISKMDDPFHIIIKASKFDNPVEGGLIVIHDIKYELGKDGIINSCEIGNSNDNEENNLLPLNDIPSITVNSETLTNKDDNLKDEEVVKEIELNNRIYPLPKDKLDSVINNDHLQLSSKTKKNIHNEINRNVILPTDINNDSIKGEESKMSCDVVKCSPERLAKETNCLYNNYVISSDGEESLGSGWEVVLVEDFSPHDFLKDKYYNKKNFVENLFLTANFYGIDSPTYIFESPNINFSDNKEFYLSFQRHISIKGAELVVCGNKNGSNCFWSSEGDDIKDEWIIEHVPLIPGLSNIVFIAKSNYNVSPQTIGQVGIFDIKMYIRKNDSLIRYC
uniref:MAM domain-containing protein n=1 Tax=Strongyloides venezuelensis TaxID=75913 RepID=A0A0K0FCS0_STRVS